MILLVLMIYLNIYKLDIYFEHCDIRKTSFGLSSMPLSVLRNLTVLAGFHSL